MASHRGGCQVVCVLRYSQQIWPAECVVMANACVGPDARKAHHRHCLARQLLDFKIMQQLVWACRQRKRKIALALAGD